VIIGIDYTPAYEQVGGIGRYVRELVTALAKCDDSTDYRLFVAGAGTLPDRPGQNFHWKQARLSAEWFARLWHRVRLPALIELWTGRLDIFHATDFVLPPTRARSVLTVHDLSFVRTPEVTAPALKRYLDVVVPRSVRRADHVLADSKATRDDLIALYNTPPDKVSVLYSGVNAAYHPVRDQAVRDRIRTKYQIGERSFILSVGAPHPRKNYDRLIAAAERIGAHVVIAGGRRPPPSTSTVSYLGFVDEADLPALYSAAAVMAFPSLYEGFGLPVLEAMACGTPTVTSNNSSLIEVGGDSSLLVDPLSIDSIAQALQLALTDDSQRAQMIARGFRHAAAFTWETAADQLLSVYRLLTH
jgi:glycosyltransferase involved in cell wall biosynthesis